MGQGLARRCRAPVTATVVARHHYDRGATRIMFESYRRLFDASPLPMWVYDTSTLRFLAVNTAATDVYGYSSDEFLSMTLADIRPDEDVSRMIEDVALQTGRDRGVWRHRDKAGRTIDVLVTANGVRFAGRPARMVVVQDVTESRRTEEALEARARRSEDALAYRALHDPLTGLPNRVLLADRIEQALARSGGCGGISLLFVDLDRFTLINESHGHVLGDRVLTVLAERLRGAVRATDTVARFGADQFAIVCEGSGPGGDVALRIARQVGDSIAQAVSVHDRELYVTASIGIAFGCERDSADTILRNADIAMHQAKRKGGARAEMFDEGARARMELRSSIEGGLRRALDREQFAVLYQPVVSLGTGKMVGAEALLRWNDPERGVIGPDQFVPLAEETGLIVPIGTWVLERACRDAARWNEASAVPLTVSVNVSGRQLEDAGLLAAVERALAASGLPAPLLILEITETALIGDFDSSLANLDALRGLGIGLAIDDFGTGYSSLSYISRLPLDVIKIDRSFVEGLGTDSPNAAIVSAITTMSRSLGFRVQAEGVETHRQAAALRAMACDLVQGFFFARPVPHDDVMGMITAG